MPRISIPLRFNDGTVIRNLDQFKDEFNKYQDEIFKKLQNGDLEKFFEGIYEDDLKNLISYCKSANKSPEQTLNEIAEKLEIKITSPIKSEDITPCDNDIKSYLESDKQSINLNSGECKSDSDIHISSAKSVSGEHGRTLIAISNISIELSDNETIEFSHLIFKGLNSKNTIAISKGNLVFKNITFENVTIIASIKSFLYFENCKIYSSNEGIVIKDESVKCDLDEIKKNVSFEKVETEIILPDKNKNIQKLIEDKKYTEALGLCNKAIELEPNNVVYWGLKGNVLNSFGKYQDAITCYDKAIKLNPNDAVYFNQKGDALSFLKKYPEAIFCYDKAIELEPNNGVYWNNKGYALRFIGRYNDARVCFDKAKELNPHNEDDYWKNKNDVLSRVT